MSILDSLPHTCDIKRRTRTLDTLGGSTDSYDTTNSSVSCWRQVASDREINEFMKRGVSVTDKVYFTSDIQVDERDVLFFGSDTYEVRSRAIPDASAGMSVVWRVMVEYTTTGSTE